MAAITKHSRSHSRAMQFGRKTGAALGGTVRLMRKAARRRARRRLARRRFAYPVVGAALGYAVVRLVVAERHSR